MTQNRLWFPYKVHSIVLQDVKLQEIYDVLHLIDFTAQYPFAL